jgi:hypothetical protein
MNGVREAGNGGNVPTFQTKILIRIILPYLAESLASALYEPDGKQFIPKAHFACSISTIITPKI